MNCPFCNLQMMESFGRYYCNTIIVKALEADDTYSHYEYGIDGLICIHYSDFSISINENEIDLSIYKNNKIISMCLSVEIFTYSYLDLEDKIKKIIDKMLVFL